jgi:formylglycine-generating enzyme required for sulfatase activity
VKGTRRPLPDDRGWGRGRQPAIDVSFEDARAYAEWLSKETGRRYRLPSEAEWEYAARAGTETVYWWGPKVGKNQANCGGCGSRWDIKQTAPVGSFAPNSYGLYDTAGNVWEWVEDCYHSSYTGAPADGRAWVDDETCGLRVLRGGSWDTEPSWLRSATRHGDRPDIRYHVVGFRLARTF